MSLTKQVLQVLQLSDLKGVGPKMQQHLKAANIQTPEQLLFWLPRTYEDRTSLTKLSNLQVGQNALCEGKILKTAMSRTGKKVLKVWIEADGVVVLCLFFHAYSYQVRSFVQGHTLRCYGRVSGFLDKLQMVHPEYEIFSGSKEVKKTFDPIYPVISGVGQFQFRKIISQVLDLMDSNQIDIQEPINQDLCNKYKIFGTKAALNIVHKPNLSEDIELLKSHTHPAQKRFALEEWLSYYTNLANNKSNQDKYITFDLANKKGDLVNKLLNKLPFKLTQGQIKALSEIKQDLASSKPMMRLLQGDVGCGKTLVAMLSMLFIIENSDSNTQCALLAPTEVLAKQHYENFKELLDDLGINTVCLLGQIKKSEKSKITEQIKSGEAQIIIGTHAIFQKSVIYKKLALVVIDEQHRFGVEQRKQLIEKGTVLDASTNKYYRSHQLVMTATPIPRSLAMSLYADCDYSVIDQLPASRLPIKTVVMADASRNKLIDRVRSHVSGGSQVYWVCPLIDPSEVIQAQAVSRLYQILSRALPELSIGVMHGQMDSLEKDKIMHSFKDNKIQLLVATTVIEVGVDVSNANLMVIENAQRMGLSQLHQLRGRVGRGSEQGFCVLLYQQGLSDIGAKRLDLIRNSTDGFKLSEADLEIRGPGSLLGTEQSGHMRFKSAITAGFILNNSELVRNLYDSLSSNQDDNWEMVLKYRWGISTAR